MTSKAVNLYRVSSDCSKLKLLKSFQISVFEFCFEVTEGILAVLTSGGKVSLFYLYQAKGSKSYQGPNFSIAIDDSLSRSINTGAKSYELLKFVPRLDWNQVYLFKIYDLAYLVHLDNIRGYLYFYQLVLDKTPVVYATFKIIQGIYGLGLSENLVILQSYNTQETLIYDIQSQLHDYLIKVNHSEVVELRNNRHSAEFSTKIDLTSDFYFVDDEVILDLKKTSFTFYVIDPANLIENHPDDVKIILFLLRRDNCKLKVLEKLKEMLLFKIPMKRLEIIFSTLASAYKIAKKDKGNDVGRRKQSDLNEHLEMSPTELDPGLELKIESGVTVLMQSEIYMYVFVPVYKHINDQRYFAEALICFTHFLIQSRIQIHFSIQYLLFKVLAKIQDFVRMQKLVENKFFTDSQDIALFLTSVGKTENIKYFPNCFVLGIDMLHRLKLYDVIMSELADQEFYYESLAIGKSTDANEANFTEIIKKCGFEYE